MNSLMLLEVKQNTAQSKTQVLPQVLNLGYSSAQMLMGTSLCQKYLTSLKMTC